LQLELLKMDPTFLNRNVNQGFSGGEKKRNEILQLAVLDVSCWRWLALLLGAVVWCGVVWCGAGRVQPSASF
jgi:hypothetical protein